jgi:hypothetical protein
MIQTQIMENHRVPIIVLEFVRDMSSDVVVDLGEVLMYVSQLFVLESLWSPQATYRDEEARCPVGAVKDARE